MATQLAATIRVTSPYAFTIQVEALRSLEKPIGIDRVYVEELRFFFSGF